jgi:hypothetical protein
VFITDPECTTFTVTRLASGVTYEFKVNSEVGEWESGWVGGWLTDWLVD